jgi:hypothetical protein
MGHIENFHGNGGNAGGVPEGEGFELSVGMRPEENCGFPGLAISVIVPKPGPNSIQKGSQERASG